MIGHDTTATTIGMAIYNMALNKNVEAKVLQEIKSFGRSKNLAAQDLEKVGIYYHLL